MSEVYILHGQGGDFYLGSDEWEKLLTLGMRYGWEPAGTLPSNLVGEEGETGQSVCQTAEPWSGTYSTHDLQEVSAEDAAALADALERALSNTPDLPLAPESFPHDVDDVERLLTYGRARIRDFVAYCRAGFFLLA